MDDVEAQGYRPSFDDATSEAREKLKRFLKLKLPRQTTDMLNECFSGMSLPPSFGEEIPWTKLVVTPASTLHVR